jgi:hypothetical protein
MAGTLFSDLKSRLMGAAKPRLHLAAFGKHPGWNDHLEDLGMDTEALIAARQVLYVQGIGGLTDSGAWESAPGSEEAPPFQHVFLWTGGTDWLFGRLWASSDGVGRTHYPMILCAQLENPPDGDALAPWLMRCMAEWEMACRAATSATEVRQLIRDATVTAQAELDQLSVEAALPPGIFAELMGLSAESEEVARLVYALKSDFQAFTAVPRKEAEVNLRMAQSKLMPQHLRVPALAEDAGGSLVFWRAVLREFIDPAAPLLMIAPLGRPWLDIIAGPVTMKHLFCLRASPAALPLTSEVPFNVPDEARESALALGRKLDFAPGKTTDVPRS